MEGVEYGATGGIEGVEGVWTWSIMGRVVYRDGTRGGVWEHELFHLVLRDNQWLVGVKYLETK